MKKIQITIGKDCDITQLKGVNYKDFKKHNDISKKVAKELIYQTAFGSIDLLLKSKKNPKTLKKNIAVKGGTTEAAINIFERKSQFKKIIGQALNAAYNHSKRLGDN